MSDSIKEFETEVKALFRDARDEILLDQAQDMIRATENSLCWKDPDFKKLCRKVAIRFVELLTTEGTP